MLLLGLSPLHGILMDHDGVHVTTAHHILKSQQGAAAITCVRFCGAAVVGVRGAHDAGGGQLTVFKEGELARTLEFHPAIPTGCHTSIGAHIKVHNAVVGGQFTGDIIPTVLQEHSQGGARFLQAGIVPVPDLPGQSFTILPMLVVAMEAGSHLTQSKFFF